MAARMTFTSVAGLNKALRKLPKDATARLRDASKDIASKIATDAQRRANAEGGIAAIVAPTIRASRDRVPVVRMGGSQKLPESGDGWEHGRDGSRQTIGDIIWGAEFGALAYTQFEPWRGNDTGAGYFLWPAVRQDSDWIQDRYSAALDDALQAIRP